MLQAVDIVAGRLTFLVVTDREAFADGMASETFLAYNIDKELVFLVPSARCSLAVASQSDYSLSHHLAMQVYWPFFKDFGPLNLGLAFRFCRKTAQLLQVRSRMCWSAEIRSERVLEKCNLGCLRTLLGGRRSRSRICFRVGLVCRKQRRKEGTWYTTLVQAISTKQMPLFW